MTLPAPEYIVSIVFHTSTAVESVSNCPEMDMSIDVNSQATTTELVASHIFHSSSSLSEGSLQPDSTNLWSPFALRRNIALLDHLRKFFVPSSLMSFSCSSIFCTRNGSDFTAVRLDDVASSILVLSNFVICS